MALPFTTALLANRSFLTKGNLVEVMGSIPESRRAGKVEKTVLAEEKVARTFPLASSRSGSIIRLEEKLEGHEWEV